MKRPKRIVLAVISSLVTVVVAVVLVAWWLFDAEQARQQLEAGLGDALGMDVQIGQPPRLDLLRGASVTLADLEVSRQGESVATVGEVRVRVALFSLLSGTVRPIQLHLEQPELSIERYGPGRFNVYPGEAEREVLEELSLRYLRVSDARISYRDQASGLEWLLEQCDLELRNIRHAGGGLEQASSTLAANGELKCQSLSQDQFVVSDLSAEISGDAGVFDLSPIGAKAFEGQVSGQLEVDLSSSPPAFSLTGQLSRFELGAFISMLEPEQATSGKMDLELALKGQGRTWQQIRNSVAGTLSLEAGELTLAGYDLDDELDGYSATQRFDLIDVGAVFLAGPVGLVASRGYTFSGLLTGSGGSTRIDQMVSEWTVEDGHARARDVAFRTPENRLALAGGLDFTEYRFDDLQVAVLDDDGCAIVEQKITGPFREPEVEQPNFLVTVAGPLLDLVERGIQAITDEDCEAFYVGIIQHP